MKAMILAAGRGVRMRPLTDSTHKGLLKVNGVPLLEHHVKNLAAIGIKEIVINVSYLSEQITNFLGSGEKYGVTIYYSVEDYPLEVGGGIIHALPLLGDEPFICINCDVWTDYPLQTLKEKLVDNLGFITLVQNPEHNTAGDFHLINNKVHLLNKNSEESYTYAGVAIYHPKIFDEFELSIKQPMLPILKKAIKRNLLSGEVYNGIWSDIGTPERLKAIQESEYIPIGL